MKPTKLVIITAWLTLVAVATAAAQDSAALPYDHKIDVVYGEVHGTGLLMDVFTPKEKSNGLAIVDVASGAWHSDRSKIRDHTLARLFSTFCSHGYTVFALRPGSRSRYTGLEMATHVKMGIRYIKLHAPTYQIDPERLGITGASAGGHLASLVAVTPEEGKPEASQPLQRFGTQVKAAAVFFPPTDFLDWNGKPANAQFLGDLFFLGGIKGRSEEEIQERAAQISPARLVKGTPIPFLLIHGDADPVVPLQQSQRMVEALKAAGGSPELIVKQGGAHPWPTLHEEVKVMADWFDQQLLDKKSGEPERAK